jgi:hypothetical protein
MVSGSYTTEGACTLVEGTPNTFVGDDCNTKSTATPATTSKQNVPLSAPIAKVTTTTKKN